MVTNIEPVSKARRTGAVRHSTGSVNWKTCQVDWLSQNSYTSCT